MNFLMFTAALDGIPYFIVPEQVIGVRNTRPGAAGDMGAQGTLIVTTGAVPDNRWVVSEPANIVVQLIAHAMSHNRSVASSNDPNDTPDNKA